MMDQGIVCAGTACLIVPSLLWGLYILAFRIRSHQAIGTIVGHDSMEGEYGTSYAPIVEFQLPDGQMVTFTEEMHTSDSGLLSFVGDLFTSLVLKRNPDKVNVIYDPKNPQKARVNGLSYLYFGPALMFIIGLGIISSGVPAMRDFFQLLTDLFRRVPEFVWYLL